LLRGRGEYERRGRVAGREELGRLHERGLLRAKAGSVQAEQDRKRAFRRLLRELGGVSEDQLAREFKGLLARLGIANGATLYSLRSSVTTAMKDANLPDLEMRHLTGHSTGDILNSRQDAPDPGNVGGFRRILPVREPLFLGRDSARLRFGMPCSSPAVGR